MCNKIQLQAYSLRSWDSESMQLISAGIVMEGVECLANGRTRDSPVFSIIFTIFVTTTDAKAFAQKDASYPFGSAGPVPSKPAESIFRLRKSFHLAR